MAFLVYVALATCFLLGALYFIHRGQEKAKQERVEQRLATVGISLHKARRRDWINLQLERAGLEIDDTRRNIFAFALFMIVLLVIFQFGIAAGTISMVVMAGLAFAILQWLFARRQVMIVAQLPRLLEQVVRMMRTGKTIGDSFFIATDDADQPLRSVMEKLKRNINLGMTIPEAFEDLADTYQLKELQVLSMGIGVNARFGGSLIDLLSNVILLIQQREKAQRQLKALTGETRASAVVLSALPLLVGAFMMVSNPDYLSSMIDDEGGLQVLVMAGAAQLGGMFVLWRMMKSI